MPERFSKARPRRGVPRWASGMISAAFVVASLVLLGAPGAAAAAPVATWSRPFANASTWLSSSPISTCGTNHVAHASFFNAKTGQLSFSLSQAGGIRTKGCPKGGRGGAGTYVSTEVVGYFNASSFVSHSNAWVVVRSNWVLNWTVHLQVNSSCACFLSQVEVFGTEYLTDLSTGVVWAPTSSGGLAYEKGIGLNATQTSLNTSYAGKMSMAMGAALTSGDSYEVQVVLGAEATVYSYLKVGPTSASVDFGPPGHHSALTGISIR